MTQLPLSELPGRRVDHRRDERQHRRHRRVRRRRTAVVLVLCLVLFGGASAAVYGFVSPMLEGFGESKDYAGPGTVAVQVQIHSGDSGRTIGKTLEKAGVVKTFGAFVDAARDEPRAGQIQPGTYGLKKEMKAADALALLLDPASRMSIKVSVREGLRVSQTFEEITADTGFTAEQLKEALADPAVGLPPEAGGDPEGYLFPATYDFEPDVTPVQVLAAMVARHKQAMDKLAVPAEQRRAVLVKASLIQAEGRYADDLPKVARVIENRVAASMALQFDSTVNFATGKTGVTTSKADRATESPYNTYKYPGLPPGPIDSPGEDAIAAALRPADGTWLYFVAVNPDTGETRFATTAEEHAANVKLFQQWLADQDKG